MNKEVGVSFEADMALDKYNLAEEAEGMAARTQFYSTELAKARTVKDSAENRVKLLKAEKSLQYRSDPPPDMKVTEAVVESLVLTNAEVVEAEQALVEAKQDVYTYDAAVAACNDKSSMIKGLIELYKSGYYQIQ